MLTHTVGNTMPPYRIGFACKYLHHDQSLPAKKLEEIQRPFNARTTTNRWLQAQPLDVARQRLREIVEHNATSVLNLITYVSQLPDPLKMVRIGSDVIPFYTHPEWRDFVQQELVSIAAPILARAGDQARLHGVRVSMHPGQFVVLASHDEGIVERSIEEFEYHVDLLKMMGYAKKFQDVKCNVHLSGRNGAEGFRNTWTRLSPEARNVITIENDEYTGTLEKVLEISDLCPIVLDIHHHYINSGEYIQSTDERVNRVVDSWRGVRPTLHYSTSPESILADHSPETLPILATLLESGHKKAKLRAHSNMMWNRPSNQWAHTFTSRFDIMVEAKAKNLASISLFEEFKEFGSPSSTG